MKTNSDRAGAGDDPIQEPTEADPASGEADPQAGLLAKLKEAESKYVYLYADFENFKKRAFKERDEVRKFGWEPLASELLEVLDNLGRATAHMPAGIDKNLAQGISLVLGQFQTALKKHGIEELVVKGKIFDPNFHEAVAQEVSPEPAGTILREEQKGYLFHGRLLRPARVVVSASPA